MKGYFAEIMCDVLSMVVASILLGWSWIYDIDAYNCDRENIYVAIHNGKKIKLNPAKPSESQSAKKIRVLFKFLEKLSYFDSELGVWSNVSYNPWGWDLLDLELPAIDGEV